MFRTPHVSIREENPVFDFELRRVKRLSAPGRLWVYSALVQVVPMLLIIILYFTALRDYVIYYNRGSTGNYYRYYSDFYNGWSTLSVITLFASALTAFFGGIYYMAVSIHSINHQINNGHWDMLRLSPLADATVLRAKEAIAHIRTWRLMQIEVSLRLSQMLLVGLLMFFQPNDFLREGSFGESSVIGGMIRELATRPVMVLGQLVLMITIPYVWIMEPRWRMRTITTIGLALSARVHNLSMASVAGFFSLFGFHLLQAALLSGTGWVFINFWRIIDEQYYTLTRNSYDIFQLVQLASFLLFFWVIYFIYWVGRRLAWRSALRQAFKAEH